MRRRSRSARVRAAAVSLALLAHVLLLLLFSFGSSRSTRETPGLQFVSIWPPDQPPPPVMAHVPSTPQPRSRAPAPANLRSANPKTTAPTAPAEPSASPSPPQQDAPHAPIDWHGEAASAAARSTAKGQSQTFSAPPKAMRQACKPKESSFQWNPEEKRVGLAPLPYVPLPYVKLGNCIIMPPFFSCALGGPPAANGHLFDDMKKGDRPVSSAPDANTCD